MTKPLVVLFTKPSRPGRVKTRLIGDLSAEQTAELHAAFLADLVEELDCDTFDLELAWALADDEPLPAGPPRGFQQSGTDLGERLWYGLRGAVADRPAVAAIGSDAPLLTRARVEEAFAELERGADVSLGPAEDGGYYLLALRREALLPEVFRGIDWSTGEVAAQTIAACVRCALRVATLGPERDVDTPGDLDRLADALAQDPTRCARTRELLARWGRLAEGSQMRVLAS